MGSAPRCRTWNSGNLPLIDSVRLDGSAPGFTIFVSLLTGVLFGLAPALESARADLMVGHSGCRSLPGRAFEEERPSFARMHRAEPSSKIDWLGC